MIRRLCLIGLCIFAPWIARAQSDSAAAPVPEKHTTTSLSVTLGVTIQNKSEGDQEAFSGVWLAGLEGKLYSERGNDQITLFTRMRYGQSHSQDAPPEKTEDDLIVSITPSMDIPGTPLRLFLENTAETQFREGKVDTFTTNFLDPLSLYEALFVGRRYGWQADDGSGTFDFTGGVGYALQQTVANEFVLKENRVKITPTSPLGDQNSVTLESGYCAILEMNYQKKLGESSSIHLGFKNAALTKDDAAVKIADAHVTSILDFGVQYSIFSIDYSGHMLYDHNISLRRQLDQSLVFGLRLDL